MAYIVQVPANLLALDVDAWVIDINSNNLLNAFWQYGSSEEITDIPIYGQDTNDDGWADPGEHLTVETGAGQIPGEYVGPITISTGNVDLGIPGLAQLNIQLNSIDAHIIRGDDGNNYLISDEPFDEHHLSASATVTLVGGLIPPFTITAPVSGIANAITDVINDAGQAAYDTAYDIAYAAGFLLPMPARILAAQVAGEIAKEPFDILAAGIQGVANLTQDIADLAVVTVAPGTGQLAIVCFGRGALIQTGNGLVAVENLKVGDMVQTRDHGLQPIRWLGSIKLSRIQLARTPNLRPIRIQAGSLGDGIPSAELTVSPQHRILVRSKIAQKMFGTDEILVAAKQLLQIDGIDIVTDLQEVEYFHFLFDRHEIVVSNGAETESLYTGPEAIRTVGEAALEEIYTLFPELRSDSYTPVPARMLASGRKGRQLAVRHLQQHRSLVS